MRDTFVCAAQPLTGGKWRRIGLDERGKHDRIVWFDTEARDRGVFTRPELDDIARPWAREHGYMLQRTKVNPYPWLVLDSDTTWPDSDLCRALNELGRRLKRVLYIREGRRTHERQEELYAAGIRRYGYPAVLQFVARPGTSLHETGDAADVGVGGFNGTNLGSYPGARRIAAELNLYFPMSWEPWHVQIRR